MRLQDLGAYADQIAVGVHWAVSTAFLVGSVYYLNKPGPVGLSRGGTRWKPSGSDVCICLGAFVLSSLHAAAVHYSVVTRQHYIGGTPAVATVAAFWGIAFVRTTIFWLLPRPASS